MFWEIDFNSPEALYLQLCHHIIRGIAAEEIQEGDSLPSVRQLADNIGINMHTVNKAYTVLRQEGYIRIDRRRGAVICLNPDRIRVEEELKKELRVILAKARCNSISKEDMLSLINELYNEYDETDTKAF